jgi:hypothetical protein
MNAFMGICVQDLSICFLTHSFWAVLYEAGQINNLIDILLNPKSIALWLDQRLWALQEQFLEQPGQSPALRRAFFRQIVSLKSLGRPLRWPGMELDSFATFNRHALLNCLDPIKLAWFTPIVALARYRRPKSRLINQKLRAKWIGKYNRQFRERQLANN